MDTYNCMLQTELTYIFTPHSTLNACHYYLCYIHVYCRLAFGIACSSWQCHFHGDDKTALPMLMADLFKAWHVQNKSECL